MLRLFQLSILVQGFTGDLRTFRWILAGKDLFTRIECSSFSDSVHVAGRIATSIRIQEQ